MSALPRYGRYVGAAALRRMARDRRRKIEAASVLPGLPDPVRDERARQIDEEVRRLDAQRIAARVAGDIAESNEYAARIAALKAEREGLSRVAAARMT